MGTGHPVAQAGRHPHQLVPLFSEQAEIETGPQQWPETFRSDFRTDAIELLVGEVAQPWHEAIAQQVAKPEQLFGETVGIGEMLARAQDGVVLQQSVQHIERFACFTRDSASREDAVLV